ncbi:MAG: LuxR C-terminal-related transcriptional regulator, partial [Sphingobacterium sp.]
KGLRGLLENHFHAQGCSVEFIEYFTDKKPDIVFHAQNPGEITGICHQLSESLNYPYYFIIRDKKHLRLCQTKNCIRNSAIIYRNQTSDEFISIIKKVVSIAPSQPSHPSTCSVCHNQRLSLREREVLFYLNSGLNQTQVAQHMQLKVKTINSHKSSAMKKLNFKNNLALVHWMLLGGLY